MGMAVSVSCECGYSSTAMVGGVRSNFRTDCPFPFLCRDCKEIFTGDLYAYQNPCGECNGENSVSYEDPSLLKGNESVASSTTVYSWMTYPEGSPPVTAEQPQIGFIERIKNLFRPPAPEPESIYLQRYRDAQVRQDGHLCPKCDEYKLGFLMLALLD